jgi:predicted adenine nucleotide alpha hydrolase (AANH) superfamily ATPase
MKILLHICCAPCTIYPLEAMKASGHQVCGFFYNPNIHPYQEFARRAATLEEFAAKARLPMIWDRSYNLEDFLRSVVFREAVRCRFCYYLRLSATARAARNGNFDAFTSTLLYSKYQNHDLIRELAQLVVQEVGVPFYYEDFRKGWSRGMTQTRQLGLYKQAYCGCIYSERDRYLLASQERTAAARVPRPGSSAK